MFIRNSLGINERKVLIYAGSIVKYQCVDEMIHLFSELHHIDSSFYFLFLSAYNNYEAISKKMKDEGLDESSYKLMSVAQHDVYRYNCAADFGLLIRADHILNKVASPTKLAEYLMAGLPIIATELVGDIKDVESDVIITPYNDLSNPEFINSIVTYGVDDEKRRLNFEKAKNYLRDNFLWSSYRKLYLNIFS